MSDSRTVRLLAWYATAARDLPWRGERDAWRILVSEVMLQQTQVETVKPYYQRFVDRFPTVADLAAAPLDEVLQCWQGLGYYRRARGLHELARQVVAQHGGQLPDDPVALRALPGVGDYTAGAVASLAFGRAVPAIDGNVNRVVSRLLALPQDPASGPGRRAVRQVVLALLPPAAAADFNQALMELGATVCLPAAPRCGECPWQTACQAAASGEPTRWPPRPERRPPRQRRHVCAVFRRGPAWLLAQARPAARWGGLWELPRVELELPADPIAGLTAGLQASLGVAILVGRRLASLPYAISGERIALEGWEADLVTGEPQPLGYQAVCWTADPATLPCSTAQRRLLAAVTLTSRPG
ncbi:MAG: A/G-specific adenine glycosylase [Fimbriimonadaceae bacterium]|nr:A/G-specific adenine glycosylase [Fimbriimonadaceae bacterium]